MPSSVMYAAVTGIALATASAMPHPRSLLDKKDKVKDFLEGDTGYQYESGTHSNTNTNYQYASSSCSVSTYTDKYAGSVSDFIYAVVSVYKDACDGWSYEHVYDKMYGWAEVWAGASASAYVSCSSSASEDGYADGCGLGDATSKASSKAYAGAYAKAIVEVVDDGHCSCGEEEIWSEVHAGLFQEITAEAYAKATAAACVEGNDYAAASAYVDCYASVWTQLFAKAVATVLIDTSCYGGNYADLHAFVDSFSVEYESCTKVLYSTPGGHAAGDGNADADSRRLQ